MSLPRSSGCERRFDGRAALACLVAIGLTCACRAGELSVSVIDASGRGVPDVVVIVSPAAPLAVPASPAAVMDQRNRTFSPRILVVRAGTSVEFPNNDTVSHQVYSFSPAKKFQLSLYKGQLHPPVTFDRSGLVVLGCNIHDQMVAWVVVVDTPYFGKTSANGLVELKELPVGDYELRTWYPAPTLEPRVQVIHVDDAVPNARVSIVLDTAGALLPALENAGAGH
jgi:plastocyanin